MAAIEKVVIELAAIDAWQLRSGNLPKHFIISGTPHVDCPVVCAFVLEDADVAAFARRDLNYFLSWVRTVVSRPLPDS